MRELHRLELEEWRYELEQAANETEQLVWLQTESLRSIEYFKVLERVAKHSETEMGRELVEGLLPLYDLGQVRVRHQAMVDALRVIHEGNMHLQGAGPLEPLAARAGKGGMLSAAECALLAVTLHVAERARTILLQGDTPSLASDWAALDFPYSLLQRLDQVVTTQGEIRDEASPTLAQIRRGMRQLQREIDREFEQLFRSARWAPYLQEMVTTVRFGRRVVPVKREFRNSVPGVVQDQSASGQTVFVEPTVVVHHQNRLTIMLAEERGEIERILGELSSVVGQHESVLERVHYALAQLDTYLAQARYAIAHGAVLPDIGGESMDLRRARHPLLEQPVPISLQLTASQRLVLISGPNTGGKTVALKTAGLMAAMAWSGMPIACDGGSRIPMLRRILVDIGDEQSLEQSLSTFSSHIVRLIPMVAQADAASLVLIDEIGAGTDPDEGAALAEAIIAKMADAGAYGVISTHYSRLKLLAFKDPRIQNAQVEFDRDTLRPTYHLVLGQPGSSHAFYIAERLGLDGTVLANARNLVDREATSLSEAILEVNRIHHGLRLTEQKLANELDEIEKMRRQLDMERQRFHEVQERERQRARSNWQRQMDDIRTEVDTTLKELRLLEGEERARAMESFRSRYRQLQGLPAGLQETNHSQSPRPDRVGDYVRVGGFPDLGVITELNGRTATVEVGAMRLKMAVGDLEKVSRPKQPNHARTRTPKTSAFLGKARSIGMECDLRGMTADEAIEVMDKYLDDAVLAGAPLVRIIHGKGTGVLRRAVTETLRNDSRVVKYRLGQTGEGGDGVTVVQLDESADLG